MASNPGSEIGKTFELKKKYLFPRAINAGTNILVQAESTLSEPISALQPGDTLFMLGPLTEDRGLKGDCWTSRNGQPQFYRFELLEPLVLRLTPLELPSAPVMFGGNGEDFENLKRTDPDAPDTTKG
jgi:hypothetical protein